MVLKKEFKGQVHYFDLPDEQAEKLLKSDKRYTTVKDDSFFGIKIEQKKRGRKPAD